MKLKSYLVLLALVVMSLSSCKNAKDVAYFQNIDDVDLATGLGLYTARIMPKDELTITVNATDPVSASVFNLSVSGTTSNSSNSSHMSTQQKLLTYLVDNEGYINYPQLGKIYVLGMSRSELQDYITAEIKPYFSEDDCPIVTVSMSNYRVTVIGEVSSPKVVSVSNERMSVLEALASAGDMGIYGKRTNVMVIREDANGDKTCRKLDFRDANVINDPYFYVQQNDVIYVTPNSIKASNSDLGTITSFTATITSVLISLTSLLYNILN